MLDLVGNGRFITGLIRKYNGGFVNKLGSGSMLRDAA